MMILKDLKTGLHILRKALLEYGYEIETERWQGATEHPAFLEILHADMQAQMYGFDSGKEAWIQMWVAYPVFLYLFLISSISYIFPFNAFSKRD